MGLASQNRVMSLLGCLMVAVLGFAAHADEGEPGVPFTATATKGDLSIEVELAGSFVAEAPPAGRSAILDALRRSGFVRGAGTTDDAADVLPR